MSKRTTKSNQALIDSIIDLIESLRTPTSEQLALTDADLFDRFRSIYQQAAHISRDEIAEMLPDENRGVFDVLYLGYTSRAQKGDPSGFSQLVKMVLDHPDFQRLAALSEFNKSPEGYVYGNLGNKVPEAKLVEMFSAFAPPLVTNLLNSLRAEEFGRLIGYLAASRMDADIQRYNDMGGEKALGLSLETWLVEEIRAADLEFVVSYPGEDRLNEATGVFSGQGAVAGVRPAGRPDHVILQYSPDSEGNSKVSAIHLGNSTSAKRNVAQVQGISPLAYLCAMVNTTHSTESELYGLPVRPYYFLYGLFCVDEAVSSGKNLSHALISSDVPRFARQALAQAHYLSLVSCSGKDAGSASPHPDRTLALFMHNPFISGCDTLDLHGLALEIQDAFASGMTSEIREKLDRKIMNMLADKLVACCDGLVQAANKMFITEGAHSNNTDSQTLVSSVLTLASVFPDAVKFSSEEDFKRREEVRQAVERLGQKLIETKQTQWVHKVRQLHGAFATAMPCIDEHALSAAFSPIDRFTGMPDPGQSVFSEEHRLREAMRQLADQVAPLLPPSQSTSRFLQTLYAYGSECSGAYVGLSDPRVAWRKDLKKWSHVLKRKKSLPGEVCQALDIIENHAFLARRPKETQHELWIRAKQSQQELLTRLEGLGYGLTHTAPKIRKKINTASKKKG